VKVKLILPALTEATSPFFRPIKYSLFPPLGLATLAAYLGADDEVHLVDEHVETLTLDDSPDLVVVQVYITNASGRTRLPTSTAAAAPACAWVGCTSRRCPRRRRGTPTTSSSDQVRRAFRGSSPIWPLAAPRPATRRGSARWLACRRCVGT
jgi:hypothetical protein